MTKQVPVDAGVASGGKALLERYKNYLAIDKGDLDTCLMEQPESYYHVSEAYVNAVSQRDTTKLELEEVTAQQDQKIRADALASERKLTETAVQNELRTLPTIMDLHRKLLEQRAAADNWQALKESYQQRSFMLRELVALYIAQRHDHALEGGAGQARQNLSEDRAQEIRRGASKVRRERDARKAGDK